MAEDSALTRFANSEIHQNVAETQRRDQPARRRRQAGRGRLDRPDRRRRACGASPRAPPRSPGSSRSSTTGAACPARPRSDAVAAALQPGDRRGDPGIPRRRPSARSSPPRTRPASIAYGSFATGLESIAVANSKGVRAAGHPDDVAAHHGLDGPGRRHRLRRGGCASTPRRSTPRRSAARPPARRARPPTPSRSSPATTRSSSRSTPSSTSSTCSATSASRRSRSRRSGASPSPASGSAATS